MLILPGGRARDSTASHAWQLANLRMAWLAHSLRRTLGDSVQVRRVQYRYRGWNSPALDALRDAEAALLQMRREVERLVIVGHSMGARVAVHLADNDISGIVALAPWWPHNDANLVPTNCRLLTVHGTADTWTDPRSSETQTRWAGERGVDARWVGVSDAGHFMLREVGTWHGLTAEFVADQLAANVY